MIAAKRRPSRPLAARPLNAPHGADADLQLQSNESILQELFAHYDLHRDGHVCPEAFSSTQRIVRRLTSGLAVSRPASATNAPRASSRPSSPAPVGSRSSHISSHGRSAGPSLGIVGTEIVGSVRGRAAHKARMPSPPAALARTNLSTPLRSPSFTSYGSAEPEVTVSDFESFSCWQNKLLETSSKNGPEKRQRLMWLVSELGKVDVAQARSQFWQRRQVAIKELNEDVDRARNLDDPRQCQASGINKVAIALAIIKTIGTALQNIQGILQEEVSQAHEGNLAAAAAEKGRQVLTEMKAQWVSNFAAVVDVDGNFAMALELLTDARDILGEEEIAPCVERVEQMRQPFDLKVATLAGSETIVKVSRISTALELKAMLAPDLGVLPYRLKLSSKDGEVLSDTKKLEEFGITSDCANVFVVIGEANRYREMSHEDFIELVVAKRVDSRAQASKRLPKGSDECDEWKFREHYVPKLIDIEEREERQRQREERIRQKRESIEAEAKDVIERLGESSEAEAHFSSMVSAAEAVCNKGRDKAMAIRADAERDLEEAMPALEAGLRALQTMRKVDLHEVADFSKPPALVLTVVEALHILLEGRKCTSWNEAKKLLRNSRLIDDMLNYDKDSISAAIIAQLEPYIARDDFNPEVVGRMCIGAANFCTWVRAMHVYHNIAQRVWPKRNALRDAEADLEEAIKEHEAWVCELIKLRGCEAPA